MKGDALVGLVKSVERVVLIGLDFKAGPVVLDAPTRAVGALFQRRDALLAADSREGPQRLRPFSEVVFDAAAEQAVAVVRVEVSPRLPRASGTGLRDRALIAVMVYSFARVSAAVGMNIEDLVQTAGRSWVRLHEKGGKVHEMPVHH